MKNLLQLIVLALIITGCADKKKETEKTLGAAFDIKAFHNTILDAGDMPLSVLEQRVHAWIEKEKK